MNDPCAGDHLDQFVYDLRTQAALIQVTEFVESLIEPARQSAATIQALARMLYVLRRLPEPTYGICGSVDLTHQFSGETCYVKIGFNDGLLELTTGGSAYDPGVGHDSDSTVIFSMEVGRDVGGGGDAIYQWLDKACAIKGLAEVEFEMINDDDGMDWESTD